MEISGKIAQTRRPEKEDAPDLEVTAKEAQLAIRRRHRDAVMQNLGLMAFLFGIVAAAMTVSLPQGGSETTYLVMFFAMCAGIWLAAYRFRYIAVVLGGLQILIYAVYQLYESITGGKHFVMADYAWLALPLLCIVAMIVFMHNVYKAEQLADVLEDKVRSMEVIEPVTGLGNLRSLYMDLERQMAYARRNELELTLMIFELRYAQELRSIMNANEFAELKRRMGRLVEEALRLEDRVYAIDDQGSLGVVCVGCGREGAAVVRERITAELSRKESFEGILDRKLRVDVRVGCCQYDREEIKNAIEFKQRTENELQYDV